MMYERKSLFMTEDERKRLALCLQYAFSQLFDYTSRSECQDSARVQYLLSRFGVSFDDNGLLDCDMETILGCYSRLNMIDWAGRGSKPEYRLALHLIELAMTEYVRRYKYDSR